MINQLGQRFNQIPDPGLASWYRVATFLLMGLRGVLPEVRTMILTDEILHASSIYHHIHEIALREGRAEGQAEGQAHGQAEGRKVGICEVILRLGARRFGPIDEASRRQLLAMDSIAQLEAVEDRLLEVTTWAELLLGLEYLDPGELLIREVLLLTKQVGVPNVFEDDAPDRWVAALNQRTNHDAFPTVIATNRRRTFRDCFDRRQRVGTGVDHRRGLHTVVGAMSVKLGTIDITSVDLQIDGSEAHHLQPVLVRLNSSPENLAVQHRLLVASIIQRLQ